MKIMVNVTTEDGELLEREAFDVSDDPMYPLGRPHGRTAVAGFVEDAARIVQARARKNVETVPDFLDAVVPTMNSGIPEGKGQ